MITSTANARIKAARKLNNRKDRHAAGALLVEGVRLLDDARQSGVRPLTVFYVPEQVEKQPAAAALLAAFQADHCETLACTDAVFATLAETVTPQGIAAVLPLPQRTPPHQPALALILDGVRDPGNAGTLVRTAAAAGADLVIFGPDTVDPFNDKTVRAGMGAHFRLPLVSAGSWDAIAELLAGAQIYLADAHADLAYDAVDWRMPSALVVGGEATGASSAARRRATAIQIPMVSAVESLNASVAGAVILFEAARQRRQHQRPSRPT